MHLKSEDWGPIGDNTKEAASRIRSNDHSSTTGTLSTITGTAPIGKNWLLKFLAISASTLLNHS